MISKEKLEEISHFGVLDSGTCTDICIKIPLNTFELSNQLGGTRD